MPEIKTLEVILKMKYPSFFKLQNNEYPQYVIDLAKTLPFTIQDVNDYYNLFNRDIKRTKDYFISRLILGEGRI